MRLTLSKLKALIQEVLEERVVPGEFYPDTFRGFLEMVEQYQNDVWIFFDTETTGLRYKNKEVQATEVAAVAFNNNAFSSIPTVIPNGTFHMKIALVPDTLDFIAAEPEQYEDPRKKTIKQLLVMAQYDSGEVVKSKPEDVAIQFTNYLNSMKEIASSQGGEVRLIAQNAVFDIGIMNELYSRTNVPIPDDVVWDTKAVFSRYLNDVIMYLRKNKSSMKDGDQEIIDKLVNRGMMSSSLGKLIDAFNISNAENWHSAIADVELTMRALYAVVDYLKSKGNEFLDMHVKPFDPMSGDPHRGDKDETNA